MWKAWALACLFLVPSIGAAAADGSAQIDSLIVVRLAGGLEQRGVLTAVEGDSPTILVLLFPGDPAVLRAEVAESKLVKSRVGGNPLVRARDLLVRPGLATVLVDCRSDQSEHCAESYIMSRERFDDVDALVNGIKSVRPSIAKVWLVGHSLGSLSSASLARHGGSVFAGAIHASTILATRATYRSLVGFDFSAARIPQLFIHHQDDRCPGTPLHEAKYVAARYRIPLVVISEIGEVRGGACQPFSQHGFVGAEARLMGTIADAVDRGVPAFN
jgi:pimeloyl-ACP methyl ester carboxylesterase